jgi:phosphate-selective porin
LVQPRLAPALSVAFLLSAAGSLSAQKADSSAPPPPKVTIKPSGYLQARVTYTDGVGASFSINRARLALAGTVGSEFSWKVSAEFRIGNSGYGQASVALQDAFVRWHHDAFGLQMGQFKTPFSREYLITLADLETVDRSLAVFAIAPKRDIGLMADYAFKRTATIQAGVFNGESYNVIANKDSTVLGVARLVVNPLPHLSLGANIAENFGDSTRYGGDVQYQTARVTLRAEYLGGTRDSAALGTEWGGYVLAAYNTSAKLQLVGKWQDYQDQALTKVGETWAWTAAANWFPLNSPLIRLTPTFVYGRAGNPVVYQWAALFQVQARF